MTAERTLRRVEAIVAGFPGGREAIGELRRHRDRIRLRGSAVAPGWRRLDRAAAAFDSLASRLGGPGEAAVLEAAVAERGLRDLAERAAGVERGLRYGGSHESLGQAHSALVAQFEQGVTAHEELGWRRGRVCGRGWVDDPGTPVGEPVDRGDGSAARDRPRLRRAETAWRPDGTWRRGGESSGHEDRQGSAPRGTPRGLRRT